MALGSNISGKKNKAQNPKEESVILDMHDDVVVEDVDAGVLEEQVETKEMVVVFRIGEVNYGLSIDIVKEIVPMPEIITLPQLTGKLIGATNIRGNVLAIVDLSYDEQAGKSERQFQYAVVINDEEYKVALAVTEVPFTIKVDKAEISDPSRIVVQHVVDSKYVQGIIKQEREMILMIDILGLLKE